MNIWGDLYNARAKGILQGPRPFSSTTWFVGSNPPTGVRTASSLENVFGRARSGDVVLVGPGTYDEANLVIPAELSKLLVVGAGPRGSVIIDPTTEDASGIECRADDVTLINIGSYGEDTTSAFGVKNTGARFTAIACRFGNGLNQVVIGPGTAAQIAALTHGTGENSLFEDCEIGDGTNGVVITSTDHGSLLNLKFRNCYFHNLPTSHIKETGGTASTRFRNLLVEGCTFERVAAGTQPTNYIILNGDNANSGVVVGCKFPTALNSTLNLVSTALLWVGNFHPAGLSTGQPS